MKYFSFILIIMALTACNYTKKEVQARLDHAQQLFETGQYGSAQQVLDDLTAHYPNDVKSRKQALVLARNIELKEQERNLQFCDSLLPTRQAEAEALKPQFIFQKTEYDHEGRWVDKTWNPATEVGNFLKTSVNEAGEIDLTAVCKSGSPIRFTQLRVATPAGEYAETQVIPQDGGANFTFSDVLGNHFEIITFQKGKDNGVIAFISALADHKITLTCEGGKRTVSRVVSEKEKAAVVRTLALSNILTEIDRLKKEREKAHKRIEYLNDKITNKTPL